MEISDPKKKEEIHIFSPRHRFLRSTNLENDLYDPAALESYSFTTLASQSLSRLALGLSNSSTLRAWRITGDFGSGKSSFSLLVANTFSKRLKYIPAQLKEAICVSTPTLLKPSQPQLVPLVIVGKRMPVGLAILRGLLNLLKEYNVHGNFYAKLEQVVKAGMLPDDDIVLDWLKRSNLHLSNNGHGDGILLILDEAGKFLEYAATFTENQDVYLLQSLAEAASRSDSHPFFITLIFHQGISAYTDTLSKTMQKEWEKVAGRYEEILWHYPVEQAAILVANALNTQIDKIPKSSLVAQKKRMVQSLKIGWYGVAVDQDSLVSLAEKLYPVHPIILPVLVKLFASFGQNERSLYSFLLGTEPFGLQEYVIKTGGKISYGLANLYDYARANFGGKLVSLSFLWKAIDGVISTYAEQSKQGLQLLKAIGIINLLNTDEYIASVAALSNSFDADITAEITELHNKGYIHLRGHTGGYWVWPNTSVNLNQAYSDAKKFLAGQIDISAAIKEKAQLQPVVARRHYIETGNLRYFDIRYVDVKRLGHCLLEPFTGDGLIIVPLCEKSKDIQTAISFAESLANDSYPNILVVITSTVQTLSSYVEEVRRWEWIERSVGDLRHDRFAREEVARQLNICKSELQKQLHTFAGLGNIESKDDARWYHNGKLVKDITNGKGTMSYFTKVFNLAYNQAPRIHNELINRRYLSSAGASARMRLCERLFEASDEAYLGMDPEKHPPEMSMYLSVLQVAGLHKKNEISNHWGVSLPDEAYDQEHCRVLPTMRRINEILSANSGERISVVILFDELRRCPLGVRDGLIPLFLALFTVMHQQELAFYEDGSFIPRVTGTNFLRLIKAPETFEVQFYPITGVRNELFTRLIQELKLNDDKSDHPDILDVVRPLIVFTGNLPEYVLKTSNLNPHTIAIRTSLLATTDPVRLLFHELPKACGLEQITNSNDVNIDHIKLFAERLKQSLDELRAAYANLLQHLQKKLAEEFEVGNWTENRRKLIAARADAISGFMTEIRLKSFCLRLADLSLSNESWLESLGNLLCSMPPAKWRDKDLYKYDLEIHNLTRQFVRVEATLYNKTGITPNGQSVRLALTRPNGEERDQVIHLSAEQAKAAENLEAELRGLLLAHGQVGIAAASQVLWQMMSSLE